MKNKTRNTMIAVAVVLLLLFFYLTPQKFFASEDRTGFHIDSVKVMDGDEEIDLTQDIDMGEIEERLFLLQGDRMKANQPEKLRRSSQYLIYGINQDEDFYIILNPNGFSYFYEDLSENGYRIQDAEDWYDMMREMTKEAREQRGI